MTAMRYFEVTDPSTNSIQYFRDEHDLRLPRSVRLSARANRIWEESETGQVSYSKLRSAWLSDMAKVDMKEFVWVKLCSKPYRG
mgnify:CR=1 FL=1